MTNTTNSRVERQRSHRRRWIAATTGTIAVVAVTVMGIVAAQGSSSTQADTPTRETNAMGMPVIANPGMGSGTAEVAGLKATPSKWELAASSSTSPCDPRGSSLTPAATRSRSVNHTSRSTKAAAQHR